MSETTIEQQEFDGQAAEGASDDAGHKGFSFEDMRLAVGDRLQVECPAAKGVSRSVVRVVGYVENLSLIVTAPQARGRRIELVDNDPVIVRVFSRQSAFAFRTSVMRVCRLPFDYVHLSFPTLIQGSVIRKATRVRTRLAAEVGPDADDPAMQPGTLLNISATGVLLHTRASVGDKSGTVRLRFGFKLHDVDSELTVAADIRNVEREDDSNGEGADYHYGLDFRNLQPNDRLMIRSFVYQTIIEQPRHVL